MTQQDVGPIDYLAVEFPGARLEGRGPRGARRPDRARDHPDPRPRRGDGRRGRQLRRRRRSPTSTATARSTWPSSRASGRACSTTTTSPRAPRWWSPATPSALLVYENTWAGPFVTAMRSAGAEVIASGRIPADDVIAALDALESARSLRGGDDMGLIGGMARTAVVAGTATAVSNRVSRRQAGGGRPQADAAGLPGAAVPAAAAAAVRAAAPAAARRPRRGRSSDDLIEKLQKLGALRDQGILTDAEFEAQKAKLLAGL